VNVRFYIDVDTGLPHFEQHGVTEAEVLRVLDTPTENRPGSGDSRILIGRASGGRFIRVVASFDEDGEGVFVITAFEVVGKPLRALRRRMKRPGQS